MIKNIIFDLGNVLITFDPEEHLKESGLNEKDREFLLREIFCSREWIELDRGSISTFEALRSIKKRNTGREKLIDNNSDFSRLLSPIENNTSLLTELHRQGYKLYYLTNFHDELFDNAVAARPFFCFFEGGIVSARVGLIKPDRRIFTRLLSEFNLMPGETLFIDDSVKNTLAAEELGMETIHLTRPELLKELLYSKLPDF